MLAVPSQDSIAAPSLLSAQTRRPLWIALYKTVSPPLYTLNSPTLSPVLSVFIVVIVVWDIYIFLHIYLYTDTCIHIHIHVCLSFPT